MEGFKMDNNLVVRTSIEIDAPASEVWKALIDPAQIKEYLFGTEAVSDWKEGSDITFRGTWEGKEYLDKGKIVEMKPGNLMKYTFWSSFSGTEDKPENYANIVYRLTPSATGTRLSLTQDGSKTEESRDHSLQNWNQVLGIMKKMLESRKLSAVRSH